MSDEVVKPTQLGETGKSTDLNEQVNFELLVLVNILLHASYQFLLLRSVSESLAVQGSSWMTEKKDDKCRESAVKILSWIQENNGYLELADITKPKFNESTLDVVIIFARWDEVEKWIEEKVEEIKGKIQDTDYEKNTEVILMLERSLSHILSYE